jgi:hypothetical protein
MTEDVTTMTQPSLRSLRGGSCFSVSSSACASNRVRLKPSARFGFIGFRCVRPVGRQLGPRSLRGGSWLNGPRLARASFRGGVGPSVRSENFGFRCVRPLLPQSGRDPYAAHRVKLAHGRPGLRSRLVALLGRMEAAIGRGEKVAALEALNEAAVIVVRELPRGAPFDDEAPIERDGTNATALREVNGVPKKPKPVEVRMQGQYSAAPEDDL